MDPFSLTVGVLGIVCQLYKVSIETYDFYCKVKEFTPAFGDLRLSLDIERVRLKLWAECMGIDQESGINERLRVDPKLLEIIKEILLKIKEAFDDSAKMMEEYQEVQDPAPVSGNDHKHHHLYHRGPRKTLAGYGLLVKWATRDKKKLEQLVKTLGRYNNDLERLATTAEQASIRRRWRTYFLAPNEAEDLRLVEEAATVMSHNDLQQEANSKAFVHEVYYNNNTYTKSGSMNLDKSAGPKEHTPESLTTWKIEFEKIQYDGVAIMANNTRTLAKYQRSRGDEEPVLVDWSRCRDDSWRRHNPEAFQLRMSNLAKVLNRDLLPKGFHVLRCIGYVFASSTTIGFVFQPPEDALPDKEPVSLQTLLTAVSGSSDIPELGTRFALAKAVTATLFEFHNIGWLHKNIQPGNILFWPSKEDNGKLNLRKPYLVGLDLSRSNQPGEISEMPLPSEGEDLYRHPRYKGQQATDFKPAYDYYSLSIVLFEIAMWRLVSKPSFKDGSSIKKASLEDPNFIQRTVTGVSQDLGRFIGGRYRDAVLATVQLEFDDIWESSSEDDRDLALQKAFQTKVVDAIEYCQA